MNEVSTVNEGNNQIENGKKWALPLWLTDKQLTSHKISKHCSMLITVEDYVFISL